MSSRYARISSITVAIVTILVASIGAGAYVSIHLSPTDSSHPVTCTYNAQGSVVLTILNSSNSNKPIPGLLVHVTESFLGCPTNGYTSQTSLSPMQTDSNGSISEQGPGTFYFTVSVEGRTYSSQVPPSVLTLSCLALYIPSNRSTLTTMSNFSQNATCS